MIRYLQHLLKILDLPSGEGVLNISVLYVEAYPKIPQNWSKTVPEGNGPIPQDAYVMLGGSYWRNYVE